MKRITALPLFLVFASFAAAENPALLKQPWTARWISVPGAPPNDYGVYHFRRTFDLASVPRSFTIHVSADNRYKLYANGQFVGLGPARGDVYHWRYETYDIGRFLKAGRNVLAAVVWNAGPDGPVAQNSDETGFLVQGDTGAERVADTGAEWKCARDLAYSQEPVRMGRDVLGYYAAGPADRVDGSKYPWGWEQPGYDDSAWKSAAAGEQAGPRDAQDMHSRKMLVPRPIPMVEMTPERLARVRKATGIKPPAQFPAQPAAITVPPNTQATILLDNDRLTAAYPELVVSGGAGATVSLGYAEALYVPGTERKDNRNEIEGKRFVGYKDVFLPDGGRNRAYMPLWWRTYRYVQLRVTTKAAPLTIEDLRAVYTGYPFERKARLEGGPAELQKMLEVGWRTARLDAHESYMDCPYYEQLQYVGDTRIQALVSVYMTGDTRLMRNAIEQLDSSRTAEGATYSRAPSRLQQYIPPFSLWWIGMVRDYWMYADDPVFVRQMLPGVHAVLSFFGSRQKPNGSLGPLQWWNFVDWTREWSSGVPPAGSDGSSAPLDLQLLLAYQWASKLEAAFGSKALAEEYDARASELRATVRNIYWDSGRKMFSDTPEHTRFSQHAQALAILARVIEGDEARDLINRTLNDKSLVQCSIYFRYYLHGALIAAGEGDRYLDMLDEWRGQLSRGLTTWAESYEPSRSDCHAWGASPNIELFRTVLGIDSAAPGFRRVVIRPRLGSLTEVSGTMPHPGGEIAVAYTVRDGKIDAKVKLPEGVEGEFVWKGQHRPLRAGSNSLAL